MLQLKPQFVLLKVRSLTNHVVSDNLTLYNREKT